MGKGGSEGKEEVGKEGRTYLCVRGERKQTGIKKGKGVPACTTTLENTNDITCV